MSNSKMISASSVFKRRGNAKSRWTAGSSQSHLAKHVHVNMAKKGHASVWFLITRIEDPRIWRMGAKSAKFSTFNGVVFSLNNNKDPEPGDKYEKCGKDMITIKVDLKVDGQKTPDSGWPTEDIDFVSGRRYRFSTSSMSLPDVKVGDIVKLVGISSNTKEQFQRIPVIGEDGLPMKKKCVKDECAKQEGGKVDETPLCEGEQKEEKVPIGGEYGYGGGLYTEEFETRPESVYYSFETMNLVNSKMSWHAKARMINNSIYPSEKPIVFCPCNDKYHIGSLMYNFAPGLIEGSRVYFPELPSYSVEEGKEVETSFLNKKTEKEVDILPFVMKHMQTYDDSNQGHVAIVKFNIYGSSLGSLGITRSKVIAEVLPRNLVPFTVLLSLRVDDCQRTDCNMYKSTAENRVTLPDFDKLAQGEIAPKLKEDFVFSAGSSFWYADVAFYLRNIFRIEIPHHIVHKFIDQNEKGEFDNRPSKGEARFENTLNMDPERNVYNLTEGYGSLSDFPIGEYEFFLMSSFPANERDYYTDIKTHEQWEAVAKQIKRVDLFKQVFAVRKNFLTIDDQWEEDAELRAENELLCMNLDERKKMLELREKEAVNQAEPAEPTSMDVKPDPAPPSEEPQLASGKRKRSRDSDSDQGFKSDERPTAQLRYSDQEDEDDTYEDGL